VVPPHYPKGERGRPPVGLERMLRLYCLGHWCNLSDPALEEALYDIEAMRRFVDIDLGREAAPDETTICKFRHLLEEHELGLALFAEINAHLADQGLQVSGGTNVDAPSSTKNQRGEHDPEMHQTVKGHPVLRTGVVLFESSGACSRMAVARISSPSSSSGQSLMPLLVVIRIEPRA